MRKIKPGKVIAICAIALYVIATLAAITAINQKRKKLEAEFPVSRTIKIAIAKPKIKALTLMAATPVLYEFDTGLEPDIPTYPDDFNWGELPEDHVEYLDDHEEQQEDSRESYTPFVSQGDETGGGDTTSAPLPDNPQDETEESINPLDKSNNAGAASQHEDEYNGKEDEQNEVASPGVTLMSSVDSTTTLEEISVTLKQIQFSLSLCKALQRRFSAA